MLANTLIHTLTGSTARASLQRQHHFAEAMENSGNKWESIESKVHALLTQVREGSQAISDNEILALAGSICVATGKLSDANREALELLHLLEAQIQNPDIRELVVRVRKQLISRGLDVLHEFAT